MKVFKLPEFAPNARGKPMIGIFPLSKDENITAVLPSNYPNKEFSNKKAKFTCKINNVNIPQVDLLGTVESSSLDLNINL